MYTYMYIYIYTYIYTCIYFIWGELCGEPVSVGNVTNPLLGALYLYGWLLIVSSMYDYALSGKSSDYAEGARPPRRQTYISVMFGLLSQSRS